MALYKDKINVKPGQGAAFDAVHAPGHVAPHAGIYRCIHCGDEIGIAKGHVLPSQNHSQHAPAYGKIEWQLLVFAEQKP